MKTSRLVVAGIAVVATLGAFFLSGATPPPPPPPVAVAPAPAMPTVDVLVASVDIQMGQVVSAQDLRWQAFPQDSTNANFVSKQGSGEEEMKSIVGSIARHPFVAAEPIRREKLIASNGSGFLSAILPPGKRAVAITTEPSGATSAGGFVLPNDYVDIVRVFRDEDVKNGREVMRADIVVSNVRVLAIGQNVQERNGEKFITSQTATLELDTRQSEQIVLAQKLGTLTLALRSIQDAAKVDAPVADDGSRRNLTLIRFGNAGEVVNR
jgi:pilus assembly protein CpaB